jgi:hypothetical protein
MRDWHECLPFLTKKLIFEKQLAAAALISPNLAKHVFKLLVSGDFNARQPFFHIVVIFDHSEISKSVI